MRQCLLDTNVALRFLLQDDPVLAQKAQKLFDRANGGEVCLVVDTLVIAELFFVLKSVYKLTRETIAKSLLKLLNLEGVKVTNHNMVLNAVTRFQTHNVDFTDAYLAAISAEQGIGMATFDQDFRKFSDVERFDF